MSVKIMKCLPRTDATAEAVQYNGGTTPLVAFVERHVPPEFREYYPVLNDIPEQPGKCLIGGLILKKGDWVVKERPGKGGFVHLSDDEFVAKYRVIGQEIVDKRPPPLEPA